jgi:hypothetical protein
MGQIVTLAAVPDAGQMFLGWSGSATGTNSTISFTMNSNSTVIANFGLPLAVALDNTNLTWTTGGDAPWFGQTQVSEDGLGAAQSGVLGGGQQSWLQAVTNLSQSMDLGFWWNVSSQPPDALTFSVDGVIYATISGTACGWQFVQANLSAGVHTLVWIYTKQSNDSPTGIPFADSGWVDEVSFTSVSTNCVSPPSGLVDWWQGDGNTLDIVGGDNGTLQNGASYALGSVGAFSFNGINQYMSTSNEALTNITNNFTMEFWANPTFSLAITPETNTGTAGICCQRYAIFPAQSPNDSAGAGVSVGTNGISVFELAGYYMPSLLVYQAPILGWTHVAVVYQNKQPTLYVNGQWVRTGQTSSRSFIYPSAELGGDPVGYGYFAGLLDEVAIFNRALSATEVQAIFNTGIAGMCRPDPGISNVSPTSGAVGNVITIQGTNLFAVAAVMFNGIPAQFIAQSNGELLAYVPINATTGPISLETLNGGIVTASGSFTVTAPECTPPPSGLIDWWTGEQNEIDITGGNNGILEGGVTFTNGEVGEAFNFDGATGFVSTSLLVTNPQPFSLSLWFRTSTTLGGALLSFGNSQTGTPRNYDRHIYMDNTGELHFGVAPATGLCVFSSTKSYNDNNWHFVCATLSATNGAALYVDGLLLTNSLSVNTAQVYNGWWRIGENNLNGWPDQPSSYYFNGQIDEISIFNRPLAVFEVQSIYNAASAGMCNGLVFDTSPTGLQWTTNGLQLQLYGPTELGPAVISVSSNLESWTPIYTNPPAASPIQFLDTAATNVPIRFYRAAQQ